MINIISLSDEIGFHVVVFVDGKKAGPTYSVSREVAFDYWMMFGKSIVDQLKELAKHDYKECMQGR
jgi:hypothetical protein